MQKETDVGGLVIFGGIVVLVYIVSFSSWSMPYHILFIGFFLVFAFLIYKDWYNSTDHWHKDDGVEGLKENAMIVDVTETQVGLRHSPKIRTTVRFDDGFRYVSHKCQVKDFTVFMKISMTDELRQEILADAQQAHATEIALRDGKL